MCELRDLYVSAGERVVSDVKQKIGRQRVESRRGEEERSWEGNGLRELRREEG